MVLHACMVGEWAVLLKVFTSSNIHMGGKEWSQKDYDIPVSVSM